MVEQPKRTPLEIPNDGSIPWDKVGQHLIPDILERKLVNEPIDPAVTEMLDALSKRFEGTTGFDDILQVIRLSSSPNDHIAFSAILMFELSDTLRWPANYCAVQTMLNHAQSLEAVYKIYEVREDIVAAGLAIVKKDIRMQGWEYHLDITDNFPTTAISTINPDPTDKNLIELRRDLNQLGRHLTNTEPAAASVVEQAVPLFESHFESIPSLYEQLFVLTLLENTFIKTDRTPFEVVSAALEKLVLEVWEKLSEVDPRFENFMSHNALRVIHSEDVLALLNAQEETPPQAE